MTKTQDDLELITEGQEGFLEKVPLKPSPGGSRVGQVKMSRYPGFHVDTDERRVQKLWGREGHSAFEQPKES